MSELIKYADHPKAHPGDPCSVCGIACEMPVVDHCHKHGWARGVLCRSCNGAMASIDRGFAPRRTTARVEALIGNAGHCPDCPAVEIAALKVIETGRRGSLRPYSEPRSAATWDAIRVAVYRRRLELGMLSQQELAARAGVALNTISRLERGVPSTRRNPSWAAIEKALEWPEGWFRDKLEGRDRPPLPDAVRQAILDAIHEVGQDLTIRQAQQIAAGAIDRLRKQGLLADPR